MLAKSQELYLGIPRPSYAEFLDVVLRFAYGFWIRVSNYNSFCSSGILLYGNLLQLSKGATIFSPLQQSPEKKNLASVTLSGFPQSSSLQSEFNATVTCPLLLANRLTPSAAGVHPTPSSSHFLRHRPQPSL